MPSRVTRILTWNVHAALWAGAGIGALVAMAVVLWSRYGSAVFFDMIAAGIASCL